MLTISDCPSDLSCTSQCTSSQYCGYCAGIGCIGEASCDENSFFDQCPEIVSQSDSAFSVRTSRLVNVSLNIEGFDPRGLNCSFENQGVISEAGVVGIDGNVVTCLTPYLEESQSLSLGLKYGNSYLTESFIDISIVGK